MQEQKSVRIYRARPDLEGNHVAGERTEDPQVVRLVPPRRHVRWVGYDAGAARRAAA